MASIRISAVCAGLVLASGAPLTYMIDQAAHTLAATDAAGSGFSVARLARYGVTAGAAGSIDCTSYLNSIPGGPWYDAAGQAYVADAISNARSMISTAKGAGLAVLMSSDLFQFPNALLNAYAANLTSPGVHCFGYRVGPSCISIDSNFTRYALSALFDEVVATFPDLDGLVFRYGENSPCFEHAGNAPVDSTSTSTEIASLTALMLFLRQELCVQRNLTVVFRTWDTSTSAFHANASFYAAVMDAVPPHPKLVMSIKHTMLDFWRRVRFNPTLGVGAHSQVVEAEVGGMYGGCGSWPLYIGSYIIDHYPEDEGINAPYGLTWMRDNHGDVFAGVLTNHQCTSGPVVNDPWMWWHLEEAVIAGWAQDPTATEPDLFDAAVQSQLGITDPAARASFRNLTMSAMQANLAIQTCAAFDVTLLEVDRPTANWMLWDGLGGLEQLANDTCHAANSSHCLVFPYLYNNSLFDVALAEKQAAYNTYVELNITAAQLAPTFANATVALAFQASVEAGVYVAGIVNAGWKVMAYGYSGDRSGAYNVSVIRAAIADYDALWAGYDAFPGRYSAGIAPGRMNDTYWQHPTSGAPGMRQSVDKYRGV